MSTRHARTVLLTGAALLLAACGGGGGSGDPAPAPITSFELLDPNPAAGNRFGEDVVILANGNIVVSAPFDSTVAASSGAVHLYNRLTQARIASIFGDTANDNLGSGGVTALANGNFVIVSPVNDVGGVADAGSVRLINGATGAQIGSTIAGDAAFDSLGLGGVTALANSSFVIASPNDAASTGSVMLINGTTGAQIGSTIAGDTSGSNLGFGGVTALANGNFVIVSPFDRPGGIVNAGSVMLVNGATGVQIGSTFTGDAVQDQLGSGGVTALANSNFVIASPLDNVGVSNSGSVMLINGTTGVQIGITISGDVANDQLGSNVAALANGNFVIASPGDDVGVVVNAGSVMLFNGATGVQIGITIAGDAANDFLGSGFVTALANGNFVIASHVDDVGGVVDAGSVMLMNGATGAQIGSTIAGDAANDFLGSRGVIALANGNFVIVSEFDNAGVVVEAGSVMLVNGATGAQIGSTIAGDAANDQLGSGGVTALANSNFVIASELDDVGAVVDAGSVRLINGATGAQIGSTIAGTAAGDVIGAKVAGSATGDFHVLGLGQADRNGLVNSGLVRVVAQ